MKGRGTVTYTCEWCGEKFLGSPSRGKAKHLCCSKECQSAFRKSQSELNCVCPVCGKEFHLKPFHKKKTKRNCCSKECDRIMRKTEMQGERNHQFGLKGEKNSSWKSDEQITHFGYKRIRVLDHPYRTKSDFVFEHRLVAEKYLLTDENSITINGKRYLKKNYDVHHKDFNKLNNSVDNLIVLTKGEHVALHNRLRTLNKWEYLCARMIPVKEGEITMNKVIFRRVDGDAIFPTKAYKGDAGWDLYAVKDYKVNSGETVMVDTGLQFQLPQSTFGAIYARSGISTKKGLRPANCVGICDCEYTGNYFIPIYNDSKEAQYIKKHDKIAQLIIQNFLPVEMQEVEFFNGTERGDKGFGSSGK